MRLINLSFIVTDDCNFCCVYCRQKKENTFLKPATINKAVHFFYPSLREKASIFFYGGEPLLAFDSIQYAVSLLEEKNSTQQKDLTFSITTNSSLLNWKILEYLNRHHFNLLLSFDGTSQDTTRQAGSMRHTRELIGKLVDGATGPYNNIAFSTNSVFTPATIPQMHVSLQEIIHAGVTNIQYSFALDEPWDETALDILAGELEKLTTFLASYYKEKKHIPIINLRLPEPPVGDRPNTFACDGGKYRMAVSPEEHVWGCVLFHEYLKTRPQNNQFHEYSFGSLDDFIENHKERYPRILANYAALKQNCFYSDEEFCFLCDHLDSCFLCPLSVAFATSLIGQIPSWVCKLKKIESEKITSFHHSLQDKLKPSLNKLSTE